MTLKNRLRDLQVAIDRRIDPEGYYTYLLDRRPSNVNTLEQRRESFGIGMLALRDLSYLPDESRPLVDMEIRG